MMKRLVFAASAVVLSFAAASTAHAQVHVGVSLGASIPTGDFGKGVKTGYSVNGLIGFSMPLSPVGFRGEVGYNAWDGKSSLGISGVKATSLSGAANIVLQVPGMIAAKPYVIGGVGDYRMKLEVPGFGNSTETKFGYNVGGGVNFGLGTLATMLEARYITVNTSGGTTHYVPVTFGIMF